MGTLDPSVGTALTDGSGKATITLEAGSVEGAGTVVATYSGGTGATTSQADFTTRGAGAVVAQTINLGTLDTSTAPATFGNNLDAPSGLSVGSTVSIKVDVVDVTHPVSPILYTGAPVKVSFTSACVQAGTASFSPTTAISIGGTAVATYKSDNNNCSSDSIQAQATVNGNQLTADTGTFTIVKAPPNAINFIGANPAIIGIKGASGAGVSETSILTFRVTDANGQPVGQGTKVNFSVQTPAGGFGVQGNATGSTDANGKVSVTVASGSVPLIGTVKATLQDDSSTAFDESAIYGTGSVSVQEGVATENRFAVAVATLNPAAGNHLGVTDQVTVRAADRYGNWVPDGTTIHFATKLGDIGSSCPTKDGGCSVTWTSQGPDSKHFDRDRIARGCFPGSSTEWQFHGLPPVPYLLSCGAHDLFGVNVITAWTTGEESFDDLNGNNQFDAGENYVDLPEYFQDYNVTGLYEPPDTHYSGEDYGDLNTNGLHDIGDGKYDGLSCAAGTTGCNRQLVDVRTAATMVLSTDNVQMIVTDTPPSSIDVSDPGVTGWGTTQLINPPLSAAVTSVAAGSSGTFYAVVADLNGNAPPAGSIIAIKAEKGTGVINEPKIHGPSSCTVGNTVNPVVCEFLYSAGDPGNSFTVTATGGGTPAFAVSQTIAVQ